MGMDESAMNAPTAKTLTLAPAESSAPLCECVITSQVSVLSITKESQKLVVPAASTADLASILPDLAPLEPEGYRRPPLRAFGYRTQSVLCTFLI
jgi:hypothetical protein